MTSIAVVGRQEFGGAHRRSAWQPSHIASTCSYMCGVCGMWWYMIRVCCMLVNLELAPLIFRGNSCPLATCTFSVECAAMMLDRPRVLARRAASATSAMGGAAGVRRHPGGRPSVVVESSGSCLSYIMQV